MANHNSILLNISWVYAEKILSKIVSLTVQIILARLLMPEHYGIIAIIMVFISICDVLVTDGFSNALIQKKRCTDLDFNSVCCLSVCISFILYGIVFFLSPYVAAYYDNDLIIAVMRVLGIIIVISAFNSIQKAYVQRNLLFKMSFYAALGSGIFSGFIGIVLALNDFGVWALSMQLLCNSIGNMMILYVQIRWKPKIEYSLTSIREIWKFGSNMVLSAFSYTIKDNIRSLVIGKYFSPADLAFYDQGKRYPTMLVGDLVGSLGQVIFPVLSERQDSIESVKEIIRKSVKISSYILLPLLVIFFVTADEFISVILTDKWLESAVYLRILCIAYLNSAFSRIAQKGILSIGGSKPNLYHDTIITISTVALILISVFMYNSVEMIAWSYVVVMLIDTVIFIYIMNKYIKYTAFELAQDYIPSFSLSIVIGIVIYILGLSMPKGLILLMFKIVVGFILYFMISKLFKLFGYHYIYQKYSMYKCKTTNL